MASKRSRKHSKRSKHSKHSKRSKSSKRSKRSKRADSDAENSRLALVDVKVEDLYKSDATLLSLVDDCFFSIFNRLPLSDLGSIAQTCKRLHQVSSEYFAHRHGAKKVLIIENVRETGDLVKGPKGEEYVDVLSTSVRNVTLGKQLASTTALERLANFYATNVMVPIKHLRFEGWVSLMKDHGRVIAKIVNKVESFTLSNSMVVGDLHECILKHLPKMNRLTLWEKDSFNEEMSYQWLENSYPNLQYFAWHTNDQLRIDLIQFFFRLNPGIRFFSLQTRSQVTLRQLVERKVRVNELFFTVTGNPKILTDLQDLCVQQGTRLHLKFPDGEARTMLAQNMAQFTQLAPYIDGLFFERNGITDSLAHTLTTFGNLKVLQLDISTGAHILVDIPTLQEIYAYWAVNAQNFDEYRESMMAYASRLPNLKRIYMRNNSRKFEKFEFDEFDAARKQLAGAGKLEIHFRTDELYYMGTLNDIQRQYDTIAIERVESEEVINPLVTEFLIGQKLDQSGGFLR